MKTKSKARKIKSKARDTGKRAKKPARAKARPAGPKKTKSTSPPAVPRQPRPASAPTQSSAGEVIRATAAPVAFVQRLVLESGHYALRHLGFAPDQAVRGGLPHGLVERLSGDVTIHSSRPGDSVPALRAPNDTVMISVNGGRGEIAVVCLNHPGAKGSGFRFVLTPLSLPEVLANSSSAQAAPSSGRAITPSRQVRHIAPTAAAPTSKVPVATPRITAVGHSELLGDVKYTHGEWIGGVGNVSLRLEGFTLKLEGGPSDITIEYGVVDARGNVSWVGENALAGSRGRAQPIYGVAGRLRGPGTKAWSLAYECRFAGIASPQAARDGEICMRRSQGAHLTAVRFLLTPHSAVNPSVGELEMTHDGASNPYAVDDATSNEVPDFSHVRILAHIEREGDRYFKWGEWVGTSGSGRAIEGIQLMGTLPNGIVLEGNAGNAGIPANQWQKLSRFVGTRGQSFPLTHVAFRISGPGRTSYALGGHLKFVGDPTTYPISAPSPGNTSFVTRKLEAFRLSLRRLPTF